jgi:hypothetical protein
MSIVLDVGVHRLRSLRIRGDRLIARSCRSLLSAVPDSEPRRGLLHHAGIPYAVCEDELVVFGDAAVEFSRLFRAPVGSLFPAARIPHHDPPARQAIAALIESLLPLPQTPHEVCCLTVPGALEARRPGSESVEFLTRLVRLQGYTPVVLGSGLAVVLAELVERSFTGIGISLGAGSCEVTLAHRGNEVVSCSLPRGGDWIDTELARERNQFVWSPQGERTLDTEAAAEWKTSIGGSIGAPRDEREKFLGQLYGDLLSRLMELAARTFARHPLVPELPRPVDVVVCGGPARVAGFDRLFATVAKATPFPVEIGQVRIAAESDYTVARGCLIDAQLGASSESERPQAA